MSKHTPGHWEQSFLNSITSENGDTIGYAFDATLGEEQAHANARLMAAAPDMLNLLRDVRDSKALGHAGLNGQQYDIDDLIRKMDSDLDTHT